MNHITGNNYEDKLLVDRVLNGDSQAFGLIIKRSERVVSHKWFALLAGLGVGLTIVNYTLPLGIHSLAIMSFSIAFSFLGYFMFLKKSNS